MERLFSQVLFDLDPSQVVQRTGEVNFITKAWNARIIMEWLASTLREVTPRYGPEFDDGRLAISCVAMILASQSNKF